MSFPAATVSKATACFLASTQHSIQLMNITCIWLLQSQINSSRLREDPNVTKRRANINLKIRQVSANNSKLVIPLLCVLWMCKSATFSSKGDVTAVFTTCFHCLQVAKINQFKLYYINTLFCFICYTEGYVFM